MKDQSQDIDWRAESRRFDTVAELYDASRPGYPKELVEDIVAVAGLTPDSKALEIGSGTGIATASFARLGGSILCLEPGANLAAVARQKLKQFPKVSFALTAFEDWAGPEGEFDLVFSAQAFHWVPKETGYLKAARALNAKGWLSLFWNMSPDLQDDLFFEMNRVYAEFAPDLLYRPNSFEETILLREAEIRESGCFEGVDVRRYPWVERYTTEQYLGLLNTYSDHLRLEEDARNRLFAGIAGIIERHGGSIEKPYVAVLYLARKKSKDIMP